MRPQKVDNNQLMTGLMTVLRAKGYDGATMSDLSEATGLKKASLYHRFPGGKKEMVEAVMEQTDAWSTEHILKVLTDKQIKPEQRLERALKNINDLYHDGNSSCILRALSMDSSLPHFHKLIEDSFDLWLTAFTQLGTDLKMELVQAEKLARLSLIKIQGSLVLSKSMNDTSIFREALLDIKTQYIPVASN